MAWLLVKDGIAVNSIEPPEDKTWVPPDNMLLVHSDTAHIGWVYNGVSFTAPKPVIIVPAKVSKAQAKIALTEAGLWDQVVATVAAFDNVRATIWFEDGADWERSNTYVAVLAAELGLTDDRIDELFVAASKVL